MCSSDLLTCAVPSWRPDVHGEADLVEEVTRIWGLDNIPPAPMERTSAIARPVLNPLQKRMLGARRMLASRGFNEAITWAFLPEDHAKLFGGGQPELKLANPISSELSHPPRESSTPRPRRRSTRRPCMSRSGVAMRRVSPTLSSCCRRTLVSVGPFVTAWSVPQATKPPENTQISGGTPLP